MKNNVIKNIFLTLTIMHIFAISANASIGSGVRESLVFSDIPRKINLPDMTAIQVAGLNWVAFEGVAVRSATYTVGNPSHCPTGPGRCLLVMLDTHNAKRQCGTSPYHTLYCKGIRIPDHVNKILIYSHICNGITFMDDPDVIINPAIFSMQQRPIPILVEITNNRRDLIFGDSCNSMQIRYID